jgi:hypothetical protein
MGRQANTLAPVLPIRPNKCAISPTQQQEFTRLLVAVRSKPAQCCKSALAHDEFGSSQSKLMILDIGYIRCLINVVDFKKLERDAEKPRSGLLFHIPL